MPGLDTDPNAVYGAPVGPPLPAAQSVPDLGWLSPETWGASWKRAKAQEDWGLNQRDHEQSVADEIWKGLKAKGVRVDAPNVTALSVMARNMRGGDGYAPTPDDALFSAYQDYRKTHPDFLPGYASVTDRESLRTYAIGKRQDELADADATLSRASGSARIGVGLLAGVGRGLQDPTSYLPIPGAGASASLGRAVLKGALWEAGSNVALGVAMEPLVRGDAAAIGEERTMGDTMADLSLQGLVGATVGGGAGLLDGLRHRRVASDLHGLIGDFDHAVPPDRRTPLEEASLRDLEMRARMEEESPYLPTMRGDTAHQNRSANAQAVLAGQDMPASPPSRRVKAQDAGGANLRDGEMARYMGVVRKGESGGSDTARAATSSAFGRYQFTSGTWLGYYKRRYGAAGLTDAQILAKRSDGALQDLMMQDMTRDSAKALSRSGLPVTAENLYTLHFAGQDRGVALLRAADDAPIASVLSADAIHANRALLEGKTVGKVREHLARVVGGEAEHVRVAAGEMVPDHEWLADADLPQLRPDLFGSAETHAREQLNLHDAIDAHEGYDVVERPERAPDGTAYFRTEKGSVYRVEADGATVRDKAARPEHPGENERGMQPKSEATFYATKDDLQKLALMQAQGGEKMAVVRQGANAAIQYVSGPDKGKLIMDTMIPISHQPSVGLHPVETWKNGERVHFGNAITETSPAPMLRDAPSAAVAPRPKKAAKGRVRSASPAAAEPVRDRAAMQRFEPDGDGKVLQVESILHDVRARMDAGELAASAKFRLSDEGDAQTVEAILADLDEDDAMIAAIRGCL